MRTKIFLLVLIPVLSYTGTAYAQSLESILESHFKIMGQEKLLSVETIITKGMLSQGGLDIEIVTYNKRPDHFRLEGRYEGYTFVEVYDGKTGWTFNQMLGEEQPRLMAEQELELLKTQANIDGLLYNYSEKGYQIELLEPESVGNFLTDVIQLSKSDGLKITFNLDSESGVILKTTTEVTIGGTDIIYESLFSDYRYVNQILFPFSVDVYVGGESIMKFEYNSIELDEEIEDYRFAIPQSLREETDIY